MQVKAIGFHLKAKGKATLNDLVARLVKKSDDEFTFRNCERRLYCSMVKSDGEVFAIGLFLTIRDHKKFLQLTEKEGKLSVVITELDDDSRPFDFNFFVFHPSSGSGLYSQYFHSCSFPVFHAYLQRQFLLADKEAESGKELDDDAIVRASKKRNLRFGLFYRRDSFEDVVKSLKEVKQFEYDILSPKSMTEDVRPIGAKLKLERRQIRFDSNVSGQSFWSRIANLLPGSSDGGQRFRVIGKDDSGDRLLIDLVAPDHFSQDDFDDLASDETLTLSEISKSAYIQKLLQTFKREKSMLTDDVGA